MDLLVADQVRAPAEALPTLLTLVGSFPSVGSLVSIPAGILAEARPTFLTLVGLFPGVDETGDEIKVLPTFITLVRPLPGVSPLVADQVAFLAEAPPTLPTFVGSFLCVNHLVPNHLGTHTES
ncbi:hypothetical protein Nmel_017198, partial [Mimus melanotis]